MQLRHPIGASLLPVFAGEFDIHTQHLLLDVRQLRELLHGLLDRRAILRSNVQGRVGRLVQILELVHGHEVKHAQCAPASRVRGMVGVHVPIRVHTHAASALSVDVVPAILTHLIVGQPEFFYRTGHVVQAVECADHAGELVRVGLGAALVFGRGAEPTEVLQEPLCGRRLAFVGVHLVLVGVLGGRAVHELLRDCAAGVELLLAEGFHEAACRTRVFLFGESRPHEGDDDAVAGLVCGVAVGGVHEGSQSQPFHTRGEFCVGFVGVEGDHAAVFDPAVFAACAGCFARHVAPTVLIGGGFLCAFDELLPRHGDGEPLLGGVGRIVGAGWNDCDFNDHDESSLSLSSRTALVLLSGTILARFGLCGVSCLGESHLPTVGARIDREWLTDRTDRVCLRLGHRVFPWDINEKSR